MEERALFVEEKLDGRIVANLRAGDVGVSVHAGEVQGGLAVLLLRHHSPVVVPLQKQLRNLLVPVRRRPVHIPTFTQEFTVADGGLHRIRKAAASAHQWSGVGPLSVGWAMLPRAPAFSASIRRTSPSCPSRTAVRSEPSVTRSGSSGSAAS